MKKVKRPIAKFLIVVILILILTCVAIFGYNKVKYEREIQQSQDPSRIVSAFIEALASNNFRFANKLVVSKQRAVIDQWKADTNHVSHDCPGNWSLDDLLEIVAWGGSGSRVIDDNTVTVDSSYGCSNNEYSIHIEGAIVKYDGEHWRIDDWAEICESSDEQDSLRICYPEN